MSRLARLGVEHPGRVIGAWLVGMALLALTGLHVERSLHRPDLGVPGSGSAAAERLMEDHFGASSSLSVLLVGPRRELDRQGPRMAAALDRLAGVSVLTPWTPVAGRELRVGEKRALLVVRVDRPFEEASRRAVPAIRETLRDSGGPPVRWHLTGYADIAAGLERSSLEALRKAELLAAPALLLVLLFVFRSPVAACLPLVLGMMSIGAARGVLAILNDVLVPLDSVALSFASMFGLALGVDYALLMTSRFREERAKGRDADAAASVTAATAGQTVVFAGLALAAAMVTGYFVAPGGVLASAAVGGLAGTALGVGGAAVVVPAALVLLDPWLDRWRVGSYAHGGARSGRLAWRAVRSPALAAGLVVVLMAMLAAPALGLRTGSPDPRMLPRSSPEYRDAMALSEGLGGAAAGWAVPYEIVIATEDGTIADTARLRAIDAWQAELASDPGVSSILGPGAIFNRSRGLRAVPRRLERVRRAARRSQHGQRRLHRGIGRASKAVDELTGRMADAATGASRLEHGVRKARRGATSLRGGIAVAKAGMGGLAHGAAQAGGASRQLRSRVSRARARSVAGLASIRLLHDELQRDAGSMSTLRAPVQLSEVELARGLEALEALPETAKLDSHYQKAYDSLARALGALSGRDPLTGQPVAAGYDGLVSGLTAGSDSLAQSAASVTALARRSRTGIGGLRRLTGAAMRLQRGVDRLEAGATRLGRGIDALASGSTGLREGIGRLDGVGTAATSREGAGGLASGLRDGSDRTRSLRGGLRRLDDATAAFRARTKRLAGRLEETDRLSPALRSGYFTLAALDGSDSRHRNGSAFALNIDRGGSAARVVVIESQTPQRTDDPLRRRLEAAADRLERETGAVVAVGGPAASIQDFASTSAQRLPLLMLVLMAVTYLILVPVLRSVVLPALAVALNALTVLAAFGVLAVVFQGDTPLGGPGYVDAIMAIGIASVVFGLSIDYEVFLLARIREARLHSDGTDGAIALGLRTTAGVITGAALIMTAVFAAFATADIVSLRQMGIGLTVAILLDATLVRLVLLPATIRLVGESAWWLPAWLDRLLPNLDAAESRRR